MHIIEVPDRNIKKYLPTELSECDTRQYIEMSALIFYFQVGDISYVDFRIHALYKLLEMKAVKKGNQDDEKYSKIYSYSQFIDSFFEISDDKEKVIKQYYIHNPIPDFLGMLTKYYGPADDFEDVTFGEYVDGLEAFVNFNQTGEMVYLYNLLAIFYRTKPLTRKKRLPYNPDEVAIRSKKFLSQPIGIVYGFYLYFASFQKYLTTATLHVQGNEIDLSILFDSSNSSKSNIPGLGMKGVLLNISESGVYGDNNGARNTPLWEVLVRMYDITKRDLDQAAANKTK